MIKSFSGFDLLILSGDIRDQSGNLSKIAKNFGRFFGRHKFFGAGIVKIDKLYPIYHPCLAWRRLKKVP